jgi:hypothetical protein
VVVELPAKVLLAVTVCHRHQIFTQAAVAVVLDRQVRRHLVLKLQVMVVMVLPHPSRAHQSHAQAVVVALHGEGQEAQVAQVVAERAHRTKMLKHQQQEQ